MSTAKVIQIHQARKTPVKSKLTSERIIEAGLELATRPGLMIISVRDLGAHLNVDPTAIYRYFRNKEQLMRALLDRLSTHAVAAVQAPPEDWQGRLRELSDAVLEQYMRHPAIAVEAVVLTTHGSGEADSIELMLSAFERAGLSDNDIVQHYAMLAAHILSVGSGIARMHGVLDSTSEFESSTWFDAPLRTDPATHPNLKRFGPQIAQFGDRELYRLGVESVISSAARLGG